MHRSRSLAFPQGPALRLRATQPDGSTTRLILDVPGLTEYGAFPMLDPFRLIIDVRGTPREGRAWWRRNVPRRPLLNHRGSFPHPRRKSRRRSSPARRERAAHKRRRPRLRCPRGASRSSSIPDTAAKTPARSALVESPRRMSSGHRPATARAPAGCGLRRRADARHAMSSSPSKNEPHAPTPSRPICSSRSTGTPAPTRTSPASRRTTSTTPTIAPPCVWPRWRTGCAR